MTQSWEVVDPGIEPISDAFQGTAASTAPAGEYPHFYLQQPMRIQKFLGELEKASVWSSSRVIVKI